jgi:hypothetical protein
MVWKVLDQTELPVRFDGSLNKIRRQGLIISGLLVAWPFPTLLPKFAGAGAGGRRGTDPGGNLVAIAAALITWILVVERSRFPRSAFAGNWQTLAEQ